MKRLTIKETHEACPDATIREFINRVADYEDAEEQGRLLKLQCRVGDRVYILWSGYTSNRESVYPAEVVGVSLFRVFGGETALGYSMEPLQGSVMVYFDADFGKTWFLTQEEANAALEEKYA